MSTLELENIKHPDNSGNNIALASNGTMTVDRKSSDGDIVNYRKDGTTVGAIGTLGGDLVIHSSEGGHKGLRFGNGAIVPMANSHSGGSDNNCNLGGATSRFNELYLSGGVFLGGTGSANKLNDYEQGTWQGRLSSLASGGTNYTTAQTGYYVKVGSLVHFQIHISAQPSGGSSGNGVWLTGLPFVSPYYNAVSHWIYDGFNSIPTGNVPILRTQQNSTAIVFQRHSGTGGGTMLYQHMSGGMNIMVTGTYYTT